MGRERTGQGVFLTRGNSSSCRARLPHPTRRPQRAFSGVRPGGAAPRSPGSVPPAPLLRGAAAVPPPPAPRALSAGRDYLGLRQLLGGGAGLAGETTPAGRSANGSPTLPGPSRRPAPGQGRLSPHATPAPWGAGSGRRAGLEEPVPHARAGCVTLGKSLPLSALVSPFAQRL